MDEDESISVLEGTGPTSAGCQDTNTEGIPEFQIFTNHPNDVQEASHYALNLTCQTLQKRNRELEQEIQRLQKLKSRHLTEEQRDALRNMADKVQQLEERIKEMEILNADLHDQISTLLKQKIRLEEELSSKCRELDEAKSTCFVKHVKQIKELESLVSEQKRELLQWKSNSSGTACKQNVLVSAFKDLSTEDDQSVPVLSEELCLLQNELSELQDIVMDQHIIIKQLIDRNEAQQEKQLGFSKNELSLRNAAVLGRGSQDTESQQSRTAFRILCDTNSRSVFTQPPVFSNDGSSPVLSGGTVLESEDIQLSRITHPPNLNSENLLNGPGLDDRFGKLLEADGLTTESGDNRLSHCMLATDLNQSIEIENNLYTIPPKTPSNHTQNINLNKAASDSHETALRCGYEIIDNCSLGAAKCIPPENIYMPTQCPHCNFSFSGETKETDFRQHVMMGCARTRPHSHKAQTTDSDPVRECPVCNQVFPSHTDQREFEEHVDSHFEPEFEQV